MPIPALVSSPPPTWDLECSFPYPSSNSPKDVDPSVLTHMWCSRAQNRTEYNPQCMGVGGSGVTSVFSSYLGRLGGRLTTTAVQAAKGWYYPWLMPWLSSSVNPGTRWDPAGSVVAVFDFAIAFPSPFAQGPADGVLLLPYFNGNIAANNIPTGAAPIGGLALGGNGAGDAVFRSYDAAGVILDQVTLSGITDPAKWWSARFVFARATDQQNATAALEVLGARVWDAVAGDGSWLAPPSLVANAWTYATVISCEAGTGDVCYSTSARFGRFTPAGAPVQGS